jgi:hypothetical protein
MLLLSSLWGSIFFRFPRFLMRVLDFRGDLVCTIIPEGQIFGVDFAQCVDSSRCLVAGVSAKLWKWHRRLGHLSLTCCHA